MRALAAGLLSLILWQGKPIEDPKPADFHFERAVTVKASPGGKEVPTVCAVLDGTLYAHTHTLNDMRLYSKGAVVPFALSASGTSTVMDQQADVLNAGTKRGHVVFDLRMPARAYSSVNLELNGVNYVAAAKVTGLRDSNSEGGTSLGTFTLFDLSGQHLGANGTLALEEASFPYLRVDLQVSGVAGAPAPVTVAGAAIPPSREAQTLYTTVASSAPVVQRGRQTIAQFDLPARVPVERVSFDLQPGDATNFSRPVQVKATVHFDNRQQPEPQETIGGQISRVRLTQGGKEIREESLSVAGTFGINSNAPAHVEAVIENGDDQPLAIRAVRLEMRERKLCFDGPGPDSDAWPLQLLYGNEDVAAPVFDYERLFQPGQPARVGALGDERVNPVFVAHVERKSLTERHPELLWVALLGMVSALGVVAFRSAKRV